MIRTISTSLRDKPKTWFTIIGVIVLSIIAVVFMLWNSTKSTPAAHANTKITPHSETGTLPLEIKPDKGFTPDASSPLILHVTPKDSSNTNVDEFYHATQPSQESSIIDDLTLPTGDYTIDYISPVTTTGDLFKTPEKTTVTVHADDGRAGKTSTHEIPMTLIPADQVTPEQLAEVVSQTKEAIAKGDETLKGDAGTEVITAVEAGVKANPNASEEVKEQAAEAVQTAPVDTAPVTSSKPATGNTNTGGGNHTETGNVNHAGNAGNDKPSGAGNSSDSKPAPAQPAPQPAQPSQPKPKPAQPQPAQPKPAEPAQPAPQPKPVEPPAPAPQPEPKPEPAQPVCQPQSLGYFIVFDDGTTFPASDKAAAREYSKKLAKEGKPSGYSVIEKFTTCP